MGLGMRLVPCGNRFLSMQIMKRFIRRRAITLQRVIFTVFIKPLLM